MFRSNRLEFPHKGSPSGRPDILSLLHVEPYLNSPSSTDGLIFHFLDLLMFLNLFPECFDSMCLHWKSDEGLWLMWFENIRVFMHDNQ